MNRFVKSIPLLLCLYLPLGAIEFSTLEQTSFDEVHLIRGASEDEEVIITCHGYGGNWKIAHSLPSFLPYHIIGFNFPDHGCEVHIKDPHTFRFGSLQELAPLIQIMHKCVNEGGAKQLHLYGFSAGGGAVVNALAVLNDGRYDLLSEEERRAILEAVQKGLVILDCPLKSVEEIMAERGSLLPLRALNASYLKNNLVPIDSIEHLSPLSLSLIIHFQVPDRILTNRDDGLFVEKLRLFNRGITRYVHGTEGNHSPCLPSLQRALLENKEINKSFSCIKKDDMRTY